MEALQTCKDALDGGLIGPTDYDRVKDAWLRAQSLKAAFDAGFMEERDYDKVKLEFLASLGATLSGGITAAPKSNGHHHHHHHQVPSTVAPAAPPVQAEAPVRRTPLAAPPPPAAPPKPVAPRRSEPPTRSKPQQSAPPGSAPSSRRGSVAAVAAPVSEWFSGTNLPGKSMSGYSVDSGSVDAFMAMKAKSSFPWVLYRIQSSQVVVDTIGNGDYDDFLAALPPNNPRYAVYDFFLTSSEGRKLNKLVFVLWSPNGASVKDKMMYSSTKDFFKELLDGVSCDMHADDMSDIEEPEMRRYVVATMTRK
eukprot:CAMPEP_0177766972 /NCGR_PEP_ID=MMETSP0491_2-20121128/8817_1 /TAXON_ID=63592 /ORGANISM="Tetraselmis chuii, Strain PLY429" /LENGTH=306 /DNA_ID=CAMNT_0019283437 /DNA_START=102 /DNA_END=1022 /DNA_ORIENTATION=-